jgi:hypothetical protein
MKIGEQVTTHSENWFTPYVMGLNEKGNCVEIPANIKGTIAEIKEKAKDECNIGVDFEFRNTRGMQQAVRVYLRSKSLRSSMQ